MKIDNRKFVDLIERFGIKFMEESAAKELAAVMESGNFNRANEILVNAMDNEQLEAYEDMTLDELADDVDNNASEFEAGREIFRELISLFLLRLI